MAADANVRLLFWKLTADAHPTCQGCLVDKVARWPGAFLETLELWLHSFHSTPTGYQLSRQNPRGSVLQLGNINHEPINLVANEPISKRLTFDAQGTVSSCTRSRTPFRLLIAYALHRSIPNPISYFA